MDGVELRFSHEALLAVAQKAAAMKTGARGLRGIMIFWLRGTTCDIHGHTVLTLQGLLKPFDIHSFDNTLFS